MADTGKTIGLIKALASVDPSAIQSSVDDWLDDHPEATTTVEDGAITKAKLDSSLQQTVDDVGDLKSANSYLYNNAYYGDSLPVPFEWEYGTFTAEGVNNNDGNTRYARTVGYFTPNEANNVLSVYSNVSAMWYGEYNVSAETFTRTLVNPVPAHNDYEMQDGCLYRFAIDAGSGNTIDLKNINSIFSAYIPTVMDKTVSKAESVYNLIKWPVNLINPDAVTKGKLINKQGAIVDNVSAWVSDKIMAVPGNYIASTKNIRIRVEDENDELIATYNEDTLGTPSIIYIDRPSYIRVGGVGQESIYTFMLCAGTVLPETYTHYEFPALYEIYHPKAISCIGDSMTAGTGGNGTTYPSVLQTELTNNHYGYTVEQYGGGGENCNTIISRFGATPIHCENITLPADTSRTAITFLPNGADAFNFNRFFRGVNPVVVDGIECTFSRDSDQDQTIYINRNTAGTSAHVFTRNPQAITYATREKLMNDIVVCWMGTNNPGFTAEQIIEKQRVLYNTVKTDKVLFIGLTKRADGEAANINGAMLMAWGNKFLDIRDYILEYGLADAEITPTAEDTAAIAAGNMPPSLLSDDTHFNAAGYTVIGKRVYRKLVELNWLN